MKGKKLAVWDLDETLGAFRPIRSEFIGCTPPFSGDLGLTYGIKELLEKLEDGGFVHAVATVGGPTDYANLVLDRTKLAPYFQDRVFGKELIKDYDSRCGWRKNYWQIAEALGFSDGEIPANMVVIGDDQGRDRPMDRDRPLPVFINHNCYQYDAAVIEIILKQLLEKGEGDFSLGFECLSALAEEITEFDQFHPFKGGQIDLGNGIKFQIGDRANIDDCVYRDSPELLEVPVIQMIEAPDYKRELEPFDDGVRK